LAVLALAALAFVIAFAIDILFYLITSTTHVTAQEENGSTTSQVTKSMSVSQVGFQGGARHEFGHAIWNEVNLGLPIVRFCSFGLSCIYALAGGCIPRLGLHPYR
jgi:hypothetical protein